MTATLSGSTAALKILYPDGEVPKVLHKRFPTFDKLKKNTDFVGESAYVALQTENPQGVSTKYATALGSLAQGQYDRFNISRVKRFGLARIDGEAAEAAVKRGGGALVDLWENETRGVSMTVMKCLAIDVFGAGDGIIGRGASGHSGTTWTLDSTTNMNYFDRNMRIGAVSTTGTGATVYTGYAQITGIDRLSRTITSGSAFSSQITGIGGTSYIVRAGDEIVSSTLQCMTGLPTMVEGGTSPSTVWGLTRSTDPVRFAGQTQSFANVPMEEAVQEASALCGFQGVGYPDVLVANNREIANLKKNLEGRAILDRSSSSVGKAGFSSIVIEGENGPITIVSDPFCPRNVAYLLKWDEWDLWSLGAAPHLKNYDKNDFLRVQSDDAYQVDFVSYHQLRLKNPGPQFRMTSFGA
jgi:hypothetical protein